MKAFVVGFIGGIIVSLIASVFAVPFLVGFAFYAVGLIIGAFFLGGNKIDY
jgi:hypothetical protein